jgi:hypothetical protein
MNDHHAYNPLDMDNLGVSIVNKMLEQAPVPLDALPVFNGSGLYALYYTGAVPMYSLLAAANTNGRWGQPIYVGKAIPKGGRKGRLPSPVAGAVGRSLYARLNEHRESIKSAPALDVNDFYARWLVVEPIWIPLGEALLINRHLPVWNRAVDGFGNHDPGAGRYEGKIARWDVLHPGRTWATRLQPRGETAAEIEQDIVEYLRQRLAP